MLIDKDNGYAAFLAQLSDKIPELHQGVIGDPANAEHVNAEGATVGDIAVRNEFGLGVPERSFFRDYWDTQEDEIRELFWKLVSDSKIEDIDWETILNTLGAFVDEDMRTFMESMQPPLAASTIERKGHDRTLVDTYQMQEAINHKVVL